MPLTKSKSDSDFKSNVKAELNAGKPRARALAIAYSVKRAARASGGGVHVGPISSTVPGRTDHHPMDVAAGSYVLPADHVSSLGEGNTNAGMERLNRMCGGAADELRRTVAPYARATGGRTKYASSRSENVGVPVPINAAGGEFVIPPEVVKAIGGGDIDRGHVILDKWVVENRKKHRQTLAKLPGPAKD